MRILYDILFSIFAVFYLPVFFIKGKHRGGFGSRFGAVPENLRRELAGKKVVWIHAVSVGEVGLAVGLANALREKKAAERFVITTTTVTGHEVAEKIKNGEDAVLYFPVDFRGCVRRFIRDISPCAVAILETEIWPNLIAELSDKRIPVFIMNGRISDKAMRRYRLFKFFMGPTLKRFASIGVQDERMRSRFTELGADPEKVIVTGNLKFDWRPPARQGELAKSAGFLRGGRELFFCVAGSTHEGEEEIFFKLYASVKARYPEFRLMIAPRHLERLPSIEGQALKAGVRAKRVSSFQGNGNEAEASDAVMLLDEMGVLASFYEVADLVFVGGSLVPSGGHNLVEPSFFEKPVLYGPYMDNFFEMAEEFKKNKAAVQVSGPEELEKQLEDLISFPDKRKALGLAAKDLVRRHQGATEKNTKLLLTSLGV